MKKNLLILLFFLGITGIFFYKTFLFGKIPFPGDLLLAEYNPWKSYSFEGYVPGSIPNKAQYFDTIRQIYPWKTFAIETLKHGNFPLWNPYNFAGTPLFANSQSAVLYPLNIFYFLLPQVSVWALQVALQPLLALVFTFIYARVIGLSKKGAVFSSVAYSFSLFMSVFLEYNTVGHVILFLPLVLFSVEKIITKMRWVWAALLIAAITFAFTAGHIQIFGFLYIFSLIYAVTRMIFAKSKKLTVFTIIVSFLSPLGIVALELFPLLELIKNSARASQNYNFLLQVLLIQPYQTILFIAPDIFGNPATRNYMIGFDAYPGNAIYIGVLPFLFSFLSFKYFKINFYVKFFSITVAILLLLFVRTPLTELFYRFNIPLFSTGSPTNAIFLLSFSLAILSGIGIDFWLTGKNKPFGKIVIVFLALFIFLWGFFIFGRPSIVLVKNFILPTLLFSAFFAVSVIGEKKQSFKKTAFFVLLALTILDSFYYFQKFNPFVVHSFVFPDTKIISFLQKNAGINRIWGYGGAQIDSNFHTQYAIFSAEGYDPLYPKNYGSFIQSTKNGKISTEFSNENRSDAVIAPGSGEMDLSNNVSRLKILDLLGVKYILDKKENGTTEKTFPDVRYKKIFDEGGWVIFENKKSLPRFYLADKFAVYNSNQEFESIFFSNTFDPNNTVLLNEKINGFSHEPDDRGTATLLSYASSKISIHTDSETNKILFLSDTYYPGWEAYVDNVKTEILRANYSFRGVVVPKGSHIVSFSYNPASFAIGKIITIISIVTTFCFLFLLRKFNYGKN